MDHFKTLKETEELVTDSNKFSVALREILAK